MKMRMNNMRYVYSLVSWDKPKHIATIFDDFTVHGEDYVQKFVAQAQKEFDDGKQVWNYIDKHLSGNTMVVAKVKK